MSIEHFTMHIYIFTYDSNMPLLVEKLGEKR